MEQWDEYYKLSCQLVHTSAVGTYYRMGLNSIETNILMRVQSIDGISEPIVDAAISLVIITLTYCSLYKDNSNMSTFYLMCKKRIDYIKEEYKKEDDNNYY